MSQESWSEPNKLPAKAKAIMSENMGEMRETASAMLRRKAKELRRKSDGLLALANQLDGGGNQGPQAEEALYDLACAIRV